MKRNSSSLCRLFGFRSVLNSGVNNSLVEAPNALLNQSSYHSDGWGVSYYVNGHPHVVKSTEQAMADSLFKRISGIVKSETVLAHLRKSTQGGKCITNTHPFQYGQWCFIHNGNIRNFSNYRDILHKSIHWTLRGYVLGTTDSEVLFFLFLTKLKKRIDVIDRKGVAVEDIIRALREMIRDVTELVGPMHTDDKGPPSETYLSFILTDGINMVAHNGGKELHYSTYKSLCSDRQHCHHYSSACENISTNGYVNHLMLSSEKITNENIWQVLKFGEIIAIDSNMKLVHDVESKMPESVQTPKLVTIEQRSQIVNEYLTAAEQRRSASCS